MQDESSTTDSLEPAEPSKIHLVRSFPLLLCTVVVKYALAVSIAIFSRCPQCAMESISQNYHSEARECPEDCAGSMRSSQLFD